MNRLTRRQFLKVAGAGAGAAVLGGPGLVSRNRRGRSPHLYRGDVPDPRL